MILIAFQLLVFNLTKFVCLWICMLLLLSVFGRNLISFVVSPETWNQKRHSEGEIGKVYSVPRPAPPTPSLAKNLRLTIDSVAHWPSGGPRLQIIFYSRAEMFKLTLGFVILINWSTTINQIVNTSWLFINRFPDDSHFRSLCNIQLSKQIGWSSFHITLEANSGTKMTLMLSRQSRFDLLPRKCQLDDENTEF